MKKWMIVTGLVMFYAHLQADFDLTDASTETFQQLTEINTREPGPITLKVDGDRIGKAKLHHHHKGHINYAFAEADATAVVWYNRCYKEGLQLGVGYEYSYLKMDKNPFFKRKRYPTFTATAAFFTHRACDWKWIFAVNYNIDADKWNFNDYSTWDLLLWGRYDYCDNIGLHAGLYAQTGMKMDRVWPVLGFDWQINSRWKINAVFPIDMAIIYTINDNWNLAIAGRTFNDRHRAGRKGHFRKAIWRYENSGIEGAINNITFNGALTLNVHAGYAFGGRLRIANMHNHDIHRRYFRGSCYAGGQISLNF